MPGRRRLLVAALVAVVVVLAAVVLYLARAGDFVLVVTNRSGTVVDRVRLSGSAMPHDAVLVKLPPAQRGELRVSLNREGDLRFEVSQGFNRADMAIADDVRKLDAHRQYLIIESGNRYLLQTAPPDPQ